MILLISFFLPIALRTAKTQWSFGHSECNRIEKYEFWTKVTDCKIIVIPNSNVIISDDEIGCLEVLLYNHIVLGSLLS